MKLQYILYQTIFCHNAGKKINCVKQMLFRTTTTNTAATSYKK